MSRIYWDSMLFVYWLEDNPDYAPRIAEIHKRMTARGDTLCTSVFTLGEVLTGPYKKQAVEVAEQIKAFFDSSTIELLPFTADTADLFARIRAQHRVAPADAIHLATAASAQTNLFLTNDYHLKSLTVTGIDFLAGLGVNIL